jgi:hypothetical protein
MEIGVFRERRKVDSDRIRKPRPSQREHLI